MAEPATESINLRIYDAYVVDPDGHMPRHKLMENIRLFQGASHDPFICNHPVPGQFPGDARTEITRLGLGLCFTDPEIYEAVFRYLKLRLWVADRYMAEAHARNFLDVLETKAEEADWAGRDPDAPVGLCWSLPLDPPVYIPARQPFFVEVNMQEQLVTMINKGFFGVQARHPDYEKWYAEIRVMLIGKRTRDLV